MNGLSIYFNFSTDNNSNNNNSKGITRTNKGTSLLNLPSDYIIIDIETTGLDTQYDDILEIAALKVQGNKIVDTFQTLIHCNYQIDDFITELTGITNDMLKDAPKINEALDGFINFIKNEILIGHNVNFDINFLYDNCLKYKEYYLKNDFVDTMRLSRKINKEYNHHRLKDLISLYSIKVENQHRALDDCYATFEVYNNLKHKILEIYDNEENFINQSKKKHSQLLAKSISTDITDFDEDNPFFEKECVFTGTLERFMRKDAMQIIADLGGKNRDNVTKDTNYLILGNNDYCKIIKNGKSNKQKKAESLKLKGQDIEIISENVFYDMIDNYIHN